MCQQFLCLHQRSNQTKWKKWAYLTAFLWKKRNADFSKILPREFVQTIHQLSSIYKSETMRISFIIMSCFCTIWLKFNQKQRKLGSRSQFLKPPLLLWKRFKKSFLIWYSTLDKRSNDTTHYPVRCIQQSLKIEQKTKLSI